MAVDLDEKFLLLEEILALDAELSEHDRVAGAFRMERTALVNGVLCFSLPDRHGPGRGENRSGSTVARVEPRA